MADGGTEEGVRETVPETKLCSFYSQGRCRFGAQCRNLHPAQGTHSSLVARTERGDKKPPMDTVRGVEKPPMDTVRGDEKPPLDTVRGDEKPPMDTVRGDEKPPMDTVRGAEKPPMDTVKGDEKPPMDTVRGAEKPPMDTVRGDEKPPMDTVREEEKLPMDSAAGAAKLPNLTLGTKKARMRTAGEVVSRLRWDPELGGEEFTVGYLDRFLGLLEQPFGTFSWGDLSSAAPGELAIPEHRIQYFKHRGRVVWDKGRRLDDIFGSTGSGCTIHQLLGHGQDARGLGGNQNGGELGGGQDGGELGGGEDGGELGAGQDGGGLGGSQDGGELGGGQDDGGLGGDQHVEGQVDGQDGGSQDGGRLGSHQDGRGPGGSQDGGGLECGQDGRGLGGSQDGEEHDSIQDGCQLSTVKDGQFADLVIGDSVSDISGDTYDDGSYGNSDACSHANLGRSHDNEVYSPARNQDLALGPGTRANHFVAVRVSGEAFGAAAQELQERLRQALPDFGPCLVPISRLHLTLCPLHLENPAQLEAARSALRQLAWEGRRLLPPALLLEFGGLRDFAGRVLYTAPLGPSLLELGRLATELGRRFSKLGLCVLGGSGMPTGQPPLHVTLAKLDRSYCLKHPGVRLLPEIYRQWPQPQFGCQPLEELCLCATRGLGGSGGFYSTLLVVNLY
ncbi:leukocyte receptor cluster member 9 [Mustelus asterias]